jgi:hypothetical protein
VPKRVSVSERAIETIARGHQESDGIRTQPARDEGYHVAARLIQPLGVVSNKQDRLASRALGQKVKRRKSHQKDIERLCIIAHAKCCQQGGPLAGRQTLDPFQEWM